MDIQKELQRFYDMVNAMHNHDPSADKDYHHYLSLFKNPAFQLFTERTFQIMSVYDFITNTYVFVSDSISSFSGKDKTEFTNAHGVQTVMQMLTPYSNDLMLNYFTPVMIDFCQKNPQDIPNMRFSACVELSPSNLNMQWLLCHNYILCATAEGFPILSCTLTTDVSSIKKDLQLSFAAHLFRDGVAELLLYKSFGQHTSQIDFSKRELEIVRLLSLGKSSKEIAKELFISYETVKTHRKNMLEKTTCSTTIELINLATTMGVL